MASELSEESTAVVIDDEESVCEGCRQALAEQGYGTGVARDGEQGLRLVEHSRPNAVLVDLKMPGIRGAWVRCPWATSREARCSSAGSTILCICANAEDRPPRLLSLQPPRLVNDHEQSPNRRLGNQRLHCGSGACTSGTYRRGRRIGESNRRQSAVLLLQGHGRM